MTQPLSGLLVLDFTTLLPGPLATLMLAEAGAAVVKIERSGGEEMRRLGSAVAVGRERGVRSSQPGQTLLCLMEKSGDGAQFEWHIRKIKHGRVGVRQP